MGDKRGESADLRSLISSAVAPGLLVYEHVQEAPAHR